MKKILFSVGILATIMLNAQQTLQKITLGSNQTIVELYQIRNGTSNTNVIGSEGYNQDVSEGAGGDIIYLESTGIIYDNGSAGFISLGNFPAEQIGNGNFQIATTPYINSKAVKIYNWKDGSNILQGGELTINRYDTDRDAIEDGNTNVDMLHSKWVLPHTYDSGSALPVGIWMILISRNGVLLNIGSSHPTKRIGFRWNGSQWVQQTNDPAGTPFDNLQQATLGVNDFENNKAEIQVYPNPAKDFIILKNKKTESFVYQIFDLSGKLVKKGKRNFNEKIEVKDLLNGNYVLQMESVSGEKQSLKFIKN